MLQSGLNDDLLQEKKQIDTNLKPSFKGGIWLLVG